MALVLLCRQSHREVGELYVEEVVVVPEEAQGRGGEVRVPTYQTQDMVAQLGQPGELVVVPFKVQGVTAVFHEAQNGMEAGP